MAAINKRPAIIDPELKGNKGKTTYKKAKEYCKEKGIDLS